MHLYFFSFSKFRTSELMINIMLYITEWCIFMYELADIVPCGLIVEFMYSCLPLIVLMNYLYESTEVLPFN